MEGRITRAMKGALQKIEEAQADQVRLHGVGATFADPERVLRADLASERMRRRDAEKHAKDADRIAMIAIVMAAVVVLGVTFGVYWGLFCGGCQ